MQLEAAAHEGGATFLGTEFEPGFANVVAGFLTGACSTRCAVSSSSKHWTAQPIPYRTCGRCSDSANHPGSVSRKSTRRQQRYGLGYFETLDMIATMLGAELDSKDAFVEAAVLTRDVNLGWVDYAAGTVGGQRRTYRGPLQRSAW